MILRRLQPSSFHRQARCVYASIADATRGFDRISAGYRGPLYAEISPRTFPILVRRGSRLSQIRFRHGSTQIDAESLCALQGLRQPIDDAGAEVDEGIAISVDLSGFAAEGQWPIESRGPIVGFRAKRHTGVLDIESRARYDILDFWEPVYARKDQTLILDPNEFYILASKEAVQVPPDCAAEMVPFDPLVGEFRVHYAGFFDPGYGYAGAGGSGARAVLEVRLREVPFILEHGQIVGRLIFEKMLQRPASLYGQGIEAPIIRRKGSSFPNTSNRALGRAGYRPVWSSTGVIAALALLPD